MAGLERDAETLVNSVNARRSTEERVLTLARGEAMMAAIAHLTAGRVGHAERIARNHLANAPTDAAALALLGDIAAFAGIYAEAEQLFRLAIKFAPLFTDAQINLAKILALRDALPEAIELLAEVEADYPDRWDVSLRRLALLGQIGHYERAAKDFATLILHHSDHAEVWVAYGHLLNTVGDLNGSISAFRQALVLNPKLTEAWWGLANLKVTPFALTDIVEMEETLSQVDPLSQQAAPVQFALGKAYDDQGQPDAAFERYAAGNRIVRQRAIFDIASIENEVLRSMSFFSTERFDALGHVGHASPAPIFIVGLPRAGSSLIEQILASHSMIEGTSELPYIPMLIHRLLAERWNEPELTYPGLLRELDDERFAQLGQTYLDAAAIHRHTDAPYFIDKLPNNWAYTGFIRLILPNANIIDARRSAMACCWSNYGQWFANGQEFTYDLDDLGRYYRAYFQLMAHFDSTIPGSIHRCTHEDLLGDLDENIRKLLGFLGLPFEEACLRFYDNDRPVRTASAQQVRRPIQQGAGDKWRKFDPWLGPLRAALGDLA